MKKIIFISVLVLFFFSLTVVNYSCKEKIDDQDTVKTVLNEQSVNDAVFSTDAFTYVISDVLVSTDENDGDKSISTTCATVTLNPTVGYPKTLTIDYGSAGCTVSGHTVKGVVTAQLSNRIRQEGSTVTITFSSFSIDTLAISGTITMSVEEVDLQNAKIDFSTTLTNCSITIPSGDFSLDGDLDFSWEMETLSDYTDDKFEIESGTLTGTNLKDKTFTATILETLYYPIGCGNITQGKLKIETSETTYPATIDFGTGTCDNNATITTTIEKVIGNQTIYQEFTYNITLP